jgi:TolB-like protein/Tfp pilus assembly protein PilF
VVVGLARSIADEVERTPASVGIDSRPEPGVPAKPTAEPAIDRRRDHVKRRRVAVAVAAAVALVAGIVFGSRLWNARDAAVAGAPTRIAVMPFVQIGTDSATAYFTRGMTDEVSVALGSVDGVRVLPVSTVTAAGGDTADMRTLGRKLGADVVVAGSASADGDSTRIFARLLSTKDGYQLWAGNFVRAKRGAAGVHMDVARAIAAAIRRELSPTIGTVAHGVPADAETYDLYLRGRYFENRSGEANVQRAIDYYERALARDSTFAPAYAGLANLQVTLLGWGHSYAETVPLARKYADRALAIDPTLGAAHFVLGRLDWYDWRWADSEREYLRALADNPSDVQSHHMLSHTYLATGKIAESLAESQTALELEPLNPRIGLHLCVHHMLTRHFEEALVACRRGIELDSTFPDAHAKLSYVYFHMRRFNDARVEMEREMEIAGRIPLYVAQLAMIEAGAGRPTVARQLLADLNAKESPARLPLFYIAAAHVQLGELDSAMIVLEEAYSNHASELDGLLLDPAFDALRSDPRFAALLRKLGETAGGGR